MTSPALHTTEEIKALLALPLGDKILASKLVIKKWFDHWDGNVYVAFSGGKDSTILLHLVRSMYPDVVAVFSNTGLEYPEIVKFAKSHDNVEVIIPKKKFPAVLAEDGFPIINKKQARTIAKLQNPTKRNFNSRRLSLIGYSATKGTWNKGSKVSNKWMPIAFSDVRPTQACCDYLKKDPIQQWRKENKGMYGFNGMMMGEGNTRDLKLGLRPCNAFDSKEPTSIPLKFWTDKDVYEYAEKYDVEICSVYADYDLNRTGCTFCAYGAENEDPENNRFTKLKTSHPKQYDYFINRLGMGKALDYAGVAYGQEPKHGKPEQPHYRCVGCGREYLMNSIGFITEREWTETEEVEKPNTAGMHIWCKECAAYHGFPAYS